LSVDVFVVDVLFLFLFLFMMRIRLIVPVVVGLLTRRKCDGFAVTSARSRDQAVDVDKQTAREQQRLPSSNQRM
jgi:hypothetical protein